MNFLIIIEASFKNREHASPLFFTDTTYFYIKQRKKWSINGKYSLNETIHLVCEGDTKIRPKLWILTEFSWSQNFYVVNLWNKYWSPLFTEFDSSPIPWMDNSIEGYSIDPQKLSISDIEIKITISTQSSDTCLKILLSSTLQKTDQKTSE